MLIHDLASLALLRVSGPDRHAFLQGQITQDIDAVDAAHSTLCGWATAQGRLLATGQLFDWRDALWLTSPVATVDAVIRRLRLFVLRARVTVERGELALTGLSGLQATAVLPVGGQTLAAQPLACVRMDSGFAARVAGDAGRVLLAAEPAAADALVRGLGAERATDMAWRLADIRAGLPWIGPESSDLFTPQMVNLDLVGGVSFTKGCYSGQEIVARTRHLGRIKRRMLRFRCQGPAAVSPGDAIHGPGREIGRVLAAAPADGGTELLAVTQIEDLTRPVCADAQGGIPLQRLDLPYSIPELDAARES